MSAALGADAIRNVCPGIKAQASVNQYIYIRKKSFAWGNEMAHSLAGVRDGLGDVAKHAVCLASH